MSEAEKRIKKLLRLPSVENWARNNKPRLDETAFALSNFEKNPPKFSLGPVKKISARLAKGEITFDEATIDIEKISHPTVRASGRQVIPAFHNYLKEYPIEGLSAFDNFRISYPIGQRPDGETLYIPIIPTFIGIRDQSLCPVFVIPWADMKPFGDFQLKLMASILQDGLLSYQQFLDCDGEIVAFPKSNYESKRSIRRWSIRSYASMDREDLSGQFSRYSKALIKVIDDINREEN